MGCIRKPKATTAKLNFLMNDMRFLLEHTNDNEIHFHGPSILMNLRRAGSSRGRDLFQSGPTSDWFYPSVRTCDREWAIKLDQDELVVVRRAGCSTRAEWIVVVVENTELDIAE